MRKVLWVGVFLFFAKSSFAVSYTPVGIFGMGGASVTGTGYGTNSASSAYGAGLLIDFKMFRRLYMELGFLYLPRGFTETFSDGSTNELTFKSFQVPLLLRYNILNSLSIGFGPYYAYQFGTITGTSSSGSSSLTYESAGFLQSDNGFLISAAFKFPIFSFLSIIADARYVYGVQNLNKAAGATTYFRDLQFLGGVRFGM